MVECTGTVGINNLISLRNSLRKLLEF